MLLPLDALFYFMPVRTRFIEDTFLNENFIEVTSCEHDKLVTIWLHKNEDDYLECHLTFYNAEALIKEIQNKINEAKSGGRNER